MSLLFIQEDFIGDGLRVLEVAVLAVITFLYMLFLLRLVGNRALAKLTAFDFVVSVAIGALIGATITNPAVSPMEGIVAITTLVALQWTADWITSRRPGLLKVFTAPPQLIFYDGQYLKRQMRRQRLTPDEVREAIRQEGLEDEDSVHAVVLERDGAITVIPQKPQHPHHEEQTVLEAPEKESDEPLQD
jgi:uncharacterized membrane protein YcaP (DUF421 family)